MECAPAAREVVAWVAMPEAPSLLVPRVVAPSMKVTEPVGAPLPEVRVTVAVKFTLLP
jgi:hypothetical protein